MSTDTAAEPITPQDIERALQNMIVAGDEELDDAGAGLDSVSTFEEAGVLTYNRGLVLRTSDGSEFQISIVQSR